MYNPQINLIQHTVNDGKKMGGGVERERGFGAEEGWSGGMLGYHQLQDRYTMWTREGDEDAGQKTLVLHHKSEDKSVSILH